MSDSREVIAIAYPTNPCRDCRNAVPSSAYPLMYCQFLREYVAPYHHCCRFQKLNVA